MNPLLMTEERSKECSHYINILFAAIHKKKKLQKILQLYVHSCCLCTFSIQHLKFQFKAFIHLTQMKAITNS